jgi:hypothetical protein
VLSVFQQALIIRKAILPLDAISRKHLAMGIKKARIAASF